MIDIEHVCAGYDECEVLHDINLKLERGKITVLIGPNGCGKTTLLKTLIRLNHHTSGKIYIDGEDLEKLSTTDIAQRMAYVSQNRKAPDISVRRMVLHGRFAYLKYPRRYRSEDYLMADQAMEWVGIKELAERNVGQLSGGTQQKVYIAMVLAQDTPVILMDEPTVFLDISHQIRMMEMAKRLADQGKAVVMVLHDLVQTFQYADQIVVMKDGHIQMSGTPEDVYCSGLIEDVFDVTLKRIQSDQDFIYFVVKREK